MKPEADDAIPIALERGAAAGERRARVQIDGSRSLSVLSESSPLRWRYGERLDDVLEDACRRFADGAAVAADGGKVSLAELDVRANHEARWRPCSRSNSLRSPALTCSSVYRRSPAEVAGSD